MSSESSYFCGIDGIKIGAMSGLKTILKLRFVIGLFVFVCGEAHGQQVNPNNLPQCPKPDMSKNNDLERFAKWTNCWGTYTWADGEKYVGGFKKGKSHGQGTYTWADGEKYVGEHKDGKMHGRGTYTFANGDRYVGEVKNNEINGQGIFTFADGRRDEGIFENGNFIREAKVDLPNLNNNAANNTDRTDIDRERQQLAEERRRLEEEKRQQEQQAATERESLTRVKC